MHAARQTSNTGTIREAAEHASTEIPWKVRWMGFVLRIALPGAYGTALIRLPTTPATNTKASKAVRPMVVALEVDEDDRPNSDINSG